MKTASLLLFTIVISVNILGDTIKLTGDIWMPYNGNGISETGYMLDAAKIIFEKEGHQVAYEVVPWSRAVNMCREGNYDGIIGAYKSDAPDFIFPENEQGTGGQEYYIKNETKWKYDGIKSLDRLKLAVIKDYSYYPELDEYIRLNGKNENKIKMTYGSNPLTSNINDLLGGSVDIVIENNYVMKYIISKMKLQDKLISAGMGSRNENMYIAFSPKNSKSAAYAKILSNGVNVLRKTGQLKNLLAKYGLSDWK